MQEIGEIERVDKEQRIERSSTLIVQTGPNNGGPGTDCAAEFLRWAIVFGARITLPWGRDRSDDMYIEWRWGGLKFDRLLCWCTAPGCDGPPILAAQISNACMALCLPRSNCHNRVRSGWIWHGLWIGFGSRWESGFWDGSISEI